MFEDLKCPKPVPPEVASIALSDGVLGAIKLPHGLRRTDALIGEMRDCLARDLLRTTLAAQRWSDHLSQLRTETAERDLNRLAGWLRDTHHLAQEILTTLESACREIPRQQFPLAPTSGHVLPASLTGAEPPSRDSDTIFFEVCELLRSSIPRQKLGELAPQYAINIIGAISEATKLWRNLTSQNSDLRFESAPGPTERDRPQQFSTHREQGWIEAPDARNMIQLIMRHHRAPEDPLVKLNGCVIAEYTPDLIREDLGDHAQLIRLHHNGKQVGISLFNPPERCPGWLHKATAHYNDTSNGTLSLILLDPEVQGTNAFRSLMNSTMMALASTGATHIVGWVETHNQRAIRAYERLGGEISENCLHTSQAPSGGTATFRAFRIPIRGVISGDTLGSGVDKQSASTL